MSARSILATLAALCAALALPGAARSAPRAAAPASDVASEHPRDLGVTVGPVLPESWKVESASHWVVGVAVERAANDVEAGGALLDTLFGLSVAHRIAWAAPHLRLLVTPDADRYNEVRLFGGAGFRAFFAEPLGVDLAYGAGVHFDARLEEHYWLAGVTPAELTANLLSRGTWRLELSVGVRRAFAGDLVEAFLIDPNGFDNEYAEADLARAKDDHPWEGALTIVFGRRIE